MPLATTASARYTWDQRLALTLERRYTASADDLWQAIMAGAWLDEPIRLEPVVGGEVSLGSLGTGRVHGLQPRHLLVFTAGRNVYRWELTPSGETCLLVLTDLVCGVGELPTTAARLQLALEALAAHLGDPSAELLELDELVRQHTEALHVA
ncbi:SRPBCC family protein [Tenggerimyces flavus]|uniref:Uncharacterized protein n=1 Tax=Tenggerimyces flavus TaxID=1708749 RepID=A0ABV7YH13_9ACTN|nr:hypothetical protein [Tenggerimyces flavus]MBM7784021.1 hypothetical protein [Tenggerimyces flavus]